MLYPMDVFTSATPDVQSKSLSMAELLAAFEKVKDIPSLNDFAVCPARYQWLRQATRPEPEPAPSILPSIFATRIYQSRRVPLDEIWEVTPDREDPEGFKVVKIIRLELPKAE